MRVRKKQKGSCLASFSRDLGNTDFFGNARFGKSFRFETFRQQHRAGFENSKRGLGLGGVRFWDFQPLELSKAAGIESCYGPGFGLYGCILRGWVVPSIFSHLGWGQQLGYHSLNELQSLARMSQEFSVVSHRQAEVCNNWPPSWKP